MKLLFFIVDVCYILLLMHCCFAAAFETKNEIWNEMAESVIEKLKKKAGSLPTKPGVYIMMDKSGEVIYVGKAISLKNRVSSYFRSTVEVRTGHEAKTELLVSKIVDFDVIIANSEFEALVLENTLIKHHMPKYNIKLRDDKGHPFIRVDTRQEYPRFTLASKRQSDGAKYLGPYAGRSIAHTAIDAVSKAFGLPTCSRVFPRDVGRERPCLNHQIGLCRGWCLPGEIGEEYANAIKSSIAVFEGRAASLITGIAEDMEKAAEELQFERAAMLRDRLKAVKQLTERQLVISGAQADTDAVGFYRGGGRSCFVVLHYIDGRLLDKDYELFETPIETDGEAISGLLRQYYLKREIFPRTILLQEMPDDGGILKLLFTETAAHTVELVIPRRGDKRKLVETAVINAREEAERAMSRVEKTRKTVEWLGRVMALEAPPVLMEAFDISNTGDTDIVASMTVFENTRPKKSAYRRFMIKSLDSQDDYHSMEEVITRRVRRFLDGDAGFSPLPDVMLIDGGINHAAVAKRVLMQNELAVPVFGMVKDDRHRTRALVTPEGLEIGLEANPAAFALIGTVQEETHRFAIDFHRERRSKSVKKSQLDGIPGIGEKRRIALLKAFGSMKAIKTAEVETLKAVVPEKTAQQIYDFFHTKETEKETETDK